MAKILLVEDDNNLREIYEARLQAEGYEIVAARDGEEALTVAMKEKPDLIISDVMMPKISGFDMLDILRTTEETKNAKVIMMTALSQAEDKERAEKLGADRYLVKSQVTLEDVAKVARDVLEGKPEGSVDEPTPDPVATAIAAEDPVVVQTTPTTAPSPDPQPTPAVSQSAIPASEPAPTPDPVATPDPAPEPTTQPNPSPAADPAATPAVNPATVPEPVSATTPAPSAGLDAVASAQPAPVPAPPATPDPQPTQIPVGTPSDDPVVTVPAVDEPAADTITETVQTEEEAIAKQIQENLHANEATDTSVDPVEPSTPVADESSTPDFITTPIEEPPEAPPQSQSRGGRTIEPINDIHAPGPDLSAMAAKEEAELIRQQEIQQAATGQPMTVEPSVTQHDNENSTIPATPPTDNTTTSDIDPNSIAL